MRRWAGSTGRIAPAPLLLAPVSWPLLAAISRLSPVPTLLALCRWLADLSQTSDAPLSDTIVQRLQRYGTFGRLKQLALRTVGIKGGWGRKSGRGGFRRDFAFRRLKEPANLWCGGPHPTHSTPPYCLARRWHTASPPTTPWCQICAKCSRNWTLRTRARCPTSACSRRCRWAQAGKAHCSVPHCSSHSYH